MLQGLRVLQYWCSAASWYHCLRGPEGSRAQSIRAWRYWTLGRADIRVVVHGGLGVLGASELRHSHIRALGAPGCRAPGN